MIFYFIIHIFFFQPTLKLIKKATKAIASTSFPATPTIGLLQPAAGLFTGDRGCLPTVGFVSTAQTTTQQLTLGTSPAATILGVTNDYASVVRLLCSTSGTCCNTDLCNKNNLCNKKN